MPRAGGVFSLPPGSTAVPNTPVASAAYNAVLADLVADANAARPVTAGGTGSGTAVGGNDNLNVAGASIASASTVNLANATGVALTITGTVTINSFGTVAAGAERVLTFAGILTLTYNATSMILPGAANIVTAAGDVATFRSLGGGNWQCVSYQKATGEAVVVGATSADAGATAGPTVEAYRNSASPAASDAIGVFALTGKDSGGTKTTYASLVGTILDPTNASEDGRAAIRTIVAGTEADRLRAEAGIYTPGAVGGDKGADTINAGLLYMNGLPASANMLAALKVEAISATQVQVTATGGLNVTAAITSAGANGLDTGAEASNTWYNVWVIWNGTTAAALLSLSATAPTMPAGYTQKVRVGAVRNDASSNLWRTLQYGRRAQIVIGTNPTGMPAMASGNAGNVTTPTWVAVSVSAFVPATAAEIFVVPVASNPGGDGTGFILAPNNSYGSRSSTANPPTFSWFWSQMWGVGVFPPVNMVLESANIYWANSSGANVEIVLNGWEDNI